MKIYGVALLSFCFLVGKFLGTLLGKIIDVNGDVGGVGGARKTPGSGRSDVFALYPSRCFENYIRMGFACVYCSSIVCLFIRERTKYKEVRSFSLFSPHKETNTR